MTSWTLLFLLGPYFSFLWGPLILLSIRGSPPHRHNSVDLRTRLLGCASHQVCSTYVSTPPPPPPGSTFWSRSRLLPITHAQLITSCPFNLSVGQSCLHFISPLISNYLHQYPKSHNLGFINILCMPPKSSQAIWHLIHHHHITKLFYLLNQNTMFIIDKTLTSKLYIVSITKNLSIHHSSYSLFQTIQ